MNVQEFAASQHAVAGKLRFTWVIEDDNATTSQIKTDGRMALSKLADRNEFVILSDEWTIDYPELRVVADVIWWPAGDPVVVDLFDDTPSDVPA